MGELRKGLPWHGQGRLLDFGCGGGSFLARMAHQGWHVTGLDMSEAYVAEAGKKTLTRLGVYPTIRAAVAARAKYWKNHERRSGFA